MGHNAYTGRVRLRKVQRTLAGREARRPRVRLENFPRHEIVDRVEQERGGFGELEGVLGEEAQAWVKPGGLAACK